MNNLLDEIKKIAGRQEIVIGGDFNIAVSHWSGPERPTCKQDSLIQKRLAEEFGLLNCWQTANPDQPLCQTLRWTGNRTILYHCDGIFVPRSWKDRLQTCDVMAGDEWNRLSDHNPVVACFSYLEKASNRWFAEWTKHNGIPILLCHTSGHASTFDLRRMREAFPEAIAVPVHLENRERFVELFDNVELHDDGEWWES